MKQTNKIMKQTDEKGNPITFWGGLAEPKQENDYTALLKPVGTKQTAVEWLVQIYLQTNKIDNFDLEVAKEMEKEQSYSEEDMINFVEFVSKYYSDDLMENSTIHELLEQFKNK